MQIPERPANAVQNQNVRRFVKERQLAHRQSKNRVNIARHARTPKTAATPPGLSSTRGKRRNRCAVGREIWAFSKLDFDEIGRIILGFFDGAHVN